MITLSMPLHVTDVSSEKDTVQLRNLLDEASNNLKQSDVFDRKETLTLIDQVENVREYEDQLVDSDGGLILYITTDNAYYYHVDVPPVNEVTFDHRPNIVPLIKNYQYVRSYHVLLLNQEGIRLLEKSGGQLFEIDLKENDEDTSATQDAALGADSTGTKGDFGSNDTSEAGSGEFNSEHNDSIFEKQYDLKHYFNTVDRYVERNYSDKTGFPLILFGVKENQTAFREVSENNFLLEENIEESASQLHDDQIQEKIKEKEEEIIQKQEDELIDRFVETTPEYRIDDIPQDLALSAMQGQIEELIVEEGYTPTGSIDENGAYQDNERTDYLYQLVNFVFNTDGNVYILPEEQMPENVKISARLRY
ncbi:hypothetical protein [Tetragenococcus koreensis]|uniref:baeRF6 domain-containing protein n=1 Tax=Tetragenococcus koreensis TaxID=290335 RepID=UPI000F4EBFD9|nr:hypothetical protein [Tetragenococcus koreensis]